MNSIKNNFKNTNALMKLKTFIYIARINEIYGLIHQQKTCWIQVLFIKITLYFRFQVGGDPLKMKYCPDCWYNRDKMSSVQRYRLNDDTFMVHCVQVGLYIKSCN